MTVQPAFLRATGQAVLGGFAACLATVLGGLAGMVITGVDAAEVAEKFGLLAFEAVRADRATVLLFSPVAETLFFLVAFKLLQVTKVAQRQRTAILAMALIMGTVGWLLHDASDHVVAQSFGFAVLGALFSALWFSSGGLIAFCGTALAHLIWNGCILGLASLYSPRVVWESSVEHTGAAGSEIRMVGDFETLDQCRRMGLLQLHVSQARDNAQPQKAVAGRMTCNRSIRSSW
jgi:hypothetical protein